MPNDIILNLQKEFLDEAQNAPKLFRDLGKVEQYIAESYKTRSFIELIQNADDANSSQFGIYSMDNMLVVANNGRPFTVHDVESLCRSGSSNKSRGGSTIGYRGIGFKSVVNLAKSIYILSDDFKFFFNKDETRKLLPKIPDVPLIRVLHPYDDKNNPIKIARQLDQLEDQQGYSTFFIFCDIDNRIVQQELQDFDRNSLLFLNNICQINCRVDSIQRKITVSKQYRNSQRIVEIQEGNKTDTWEILTSPKDPRDMIALKINGDSIIPASQDESLVHSFTPTIEFVGAFIKINGDYSTDPSRKNIDFDDISCKSFLNALNVLLDTIVNILEGRTVRRGFFAPFVNVPNLEGNKFKVKLRKGITEGLSSLKLKINGLRVPFSSLRLCPDWLNQEDYQKICFAGLSPISKELFITYPELPIFLESVGVKRLYLNEIIGAINSVEISITGAAQLTTKIISQYRFDLTKDKIDEISSLKLFPKGDKLVSAKEIVTADELKKEFVTYLADHVEPTDLKHFVTKININPGKVLQMTVANQTVSQVLKPVEQSSQSSTFALKSGFRSTPKLQKWRSAENNALEYLKSLNRVLVASDVSKANMGYDIEAMLENGRRVYVEVKCVSSFNEPFKMTNNEYSSAHSYGDSYYIALVINDEPFQMRIVSNPIKYLSFQKQVEKWTWICDSYSDLLCDTESFFG